MYYIRKNNILFTVIKWGEVEDDVVVSAVAKAC